MTVAAACSGGDGKTTTTTRPSTTIRPTTTSTSTTSTSTTTTVARTTTTEETVPPPEDTVPAPEFGAACESGSFPDCIDPDGDGQYVYLMNGAACMEALPPELCADLDGDGIAGYPDSG